MTTDKLHDLVMLFYTLRGDVGNVVAASTNALANPRVRLCFEKFLRVCKYYEINPLQTLKTFFAFPPEYKVQPNQLGSDLFWKIYARNNNKIQDMKRVTRSGRDPSGIKGKVHRIEVDVEQSAVRIRDMVVNSNYKLTPEIILENMPGIVSTYFLALTRIGFKCRDKLNVEVRKRRDAVRMELKNMKEYGTIKKRVRKIEETHLGHIYAATN